MKTIGAWNVAMRKIPGLIYGSIGYGFFGTSFSTGLALG